MAKIKGNKRRITVTVPLKLCKLIEQARKEFDVTGEISEAAFLRHLMRKGLSNL